MDKPQHHQKEEPSGLLLLLCKRQRQHRLGPMGLVPGKGGLPAVGGNDLLHQMQAQNVRCVLPRLSCLKRRGLTVRREQQDLLLPPMQDARLAELVQALSAAGAGVVGVTVRSRTLEETFLNLTESGVSAQ